MHTWHWQPWDRFSFLTCSLLAPWPHGFFTRQFSPRSPHDLTPILHPTAQTYRLRQVHGHVVLTPSEADTQIEIEPVTQPAIAAHSVTVQPSVQSRAQPRVQSSDSLPSAPSVEQQPSSEQWAAADGLLTDRSQQAVWVCSADCTPALIADCQSGQVAAVHAGWRGTAEKIIPIAIQRLQQQGSHIKDLRVALGPAISAAAYQVSTQVALTVGSTLQNYPGAATDPTEQLAWLMELPDAPVLRDPSPSKARLDVRRVNELQLLDLGMSSEQIAIAPHCTYQEPGQFFSYRREKLKQVQWSGIVSG